MGVRRGVDGLIGRPLPWPKVAALHVDAVTTSGAASCSSYQSCGALPMLPGACPPHVSTDAAAHTALLGTAGQETRERPHKEEGFRTGRPLHLILLRNKEKSEGDDGGQPIHGF